MKEAYYLSGPMGGILNFNHDGFNWVAKQLRADGYEVLNPAENDGGSMDKSREFYLRLDLVNLSQAQGMILLPGWENSKGCWMEVAVAQELEVPIFLVTSPLFSVLDPLRLDPYNPPKTTLADRAKAIVAGSRQRDYGTPERNLEKIGKVWGALLGIGDISPRMVGLLMTSLKLVRDAFRPGDDNITDAHGYLLMVEQCKEGG